jgi:predicted enzyme related to lactoylglutathione lyase
MRLISMAAFLAVLVSPAFAQQTKGASMPAPAPVVFFDIAGKESTNLPDFYSQIFGWEVAPDGRFTAQVKSPPLVPRSDYPAASVGFTTSVTAPLPGQIRQDPSEKRVYLGVPDVTATLAAIRAKGGTIEAQRFEVPGVVVLGLFKDPGGNAMGLVEMDGDRVKIP